MQYLWKKCICKHWNSNKN